MSLRESFPMSCSTLTFLSLYFLLARCTVIGTIHSSTAPAYNNSTLANALPSSSASLASNSSTGFAYADTCWSSWDAYSTSSLDCQLTTTATSEFTFTEHESSVIYETYKLCDGHPRANATASESTSRTTASDSGTAYTTYTEVLPPSGIPESTVTGLVTSRATYYETACATQVAEPKCSIGVQDCQALMSAWSAGVFKRGKPPCTVPLSADPCDDCRIYIPTVKLIYFPVTMTGDFCGEYSTVTPTYASNLSIASTVEVSGRTYTSGSAYLSYAGISALAGNSAQCGTPLPAGILGLPSSRLSTYRGHAAAMPIASLPPYSLNFADLAPNPVPWDAWINQETCVTHQSYATCQTITQAAYRPWIVYPREFWEMASMWSKCGSDVFGIMDPPSMLPKADEVPLPTMPSVTDGGDGGVVTATSSAMPSGSAQAPTPTSTQDRTHKAGGSSPSAAASPVPHASTPSSVDLADPSITNSDSRPAGSITHGSGYSDPSDATNEAATITADFSFEPTANSDNTPATITQSGSSNVAEGVTGTGSRPGHSSPGFAISSNLGPSAGSPDASNGEAQPSPSSTQHAAGSAITAPALSILASALSPIVSTVEPPVASQISSIISQANSILHTGSESFHFSQPASSVGSPGSAGSSGSVGGPGTRQTEQPSSSGASIEPTSSTAVIATIGGDTYTIRRTSGLVILGSATLSAGHDTTISGVPIVVYSSALLVGSTFVPLLGQHSPSVGVSETSGDQLPSIEASATATSASLPVITTASISSSQSSDDGGERPAVMTIENGVDSLHLRYEHLLRGSWALYIILLASIASQT